jgi:carbon monoxide dehydrogenase subunit G
MKAMGIAAGCVALSCLAASAAPQVKVTESVKLDALPAKVWAKIGNFSDITWVPPIKASEASDANKLDSQRRLDLGGPILWEALISHNDKKMSYTYRILDNGSNQKILPVAHYRSTIAVHASGKGSEVIWSSQFEPVGATADAAKKAISGVYRAGLDNLTKALTGN